MNHQIHQGERTTERLAASAPAPLWGEEEARSLLADAERRAHQWAIDSADEHAALEAPTDRRSDVLIGLALLVLLSAIFLIGLTRI
jgi:hypothetical protein